MNPNEDPVAQACSRLLTAMSGPLQAVMDASYRKGFCDGLEASAQSAQTLATNETIAPEARLAASVMSDWSRQCQAYVQIESND